MNQYEPAILAEGLRKRYGDKPALEGLDLTVSTGTVHGLLGPNGAGKTTAVRILATLVRADGGTARVAGFDVARQPDQVRLRIGLTGQYAAVDEVLSGRQNLVMFGRLYHLGARDAARRADELLDRFGLADTGSQPVSAYSGGMRRRLDLAASMILRPPVLVLDEPTTGLDPRGRNEVWDAIRSLVDGGATVLLTTQYLEEADQLASRITVIDRGHAVAQGSPGELKSTVGGDRLDVVLRHTADIEPAVALLANVLGTGPDVDSDRRLLSTAVSDRVAALTSLVRALDDAGIAAEDIGVRRPTLDEVFLRLTGHHAHATEQSTQEVAA